MFIIRKKISLKLFSRKVFLCKNSGSVRITVNNRQKYIHHLNGHTKQKDSDQLFDNCQFNDIFWLLNFIIENFSQPKQTLSTAANLKFKHFRNSSNEKNSVLIGLFEFYCQKKTENFPCLFTHFFIFDFGKKVFSIFIFIGNIHLFLCVLMFESKIFVNICFFNIFFFCCLFVLFSNAIHLPPTNQQQYVQ